MNNTWKVRLEESSKLEFYREAKPDYELEKYLFLVKDRRHKSALTKLRINAHKLHIETGRYHIFNPISAGGGGGGIHPPPGFSLAIATKINRSTPNFLTFNFYYREII